MKISELMDKYIDNEFLIESESKADAESVFNMVAAKAKPRKHLKLRTKIIAAAAAAVLGAFLVTGWTVSPTMLVTRTGAFHQWSILGSSGSVKDEIEPYEVTDGRVYFTAVGEGEEAIDVTDTVCSGKAFIYEYVQQDSRGNEHTCLLAIGGDPENMGYAEAIFDGGHGSKTKDVSVKYGTELFYWIDGKAVAEKELTDEQEKQKSEYPHNWVRKPWVFEFEEAVMILEGRDEDYIENVLKAMKKESEEYYYTPPEGTGIVEPFVPGEESYTNSRLK